MHRLIIYLFNHMQKLKCECGSTEFYYNTEEAGIAQIINDTLTVIKINHSSQGVECAKCLKEVEEAENMEIEYKSV